MEMKHSFRNLFCKRNACLPFFDGLFMLGRRKERRQTSAVYELSYESIMPGNGAEPNEINDIVIWFDSEKNRCFLSEQFVLTAARKRLSHQKM